MEMWKACENVSCVPETNGGTNCSLWGSIQKKKSGTRGGYYIGSCIAMETLLTVRENALNRSRGTQTCNFVFCESGRKGSEIEAVELK